jgi:predicted N-acetyltransferase YhbS
LSVTLRTAHPADETGLSELLESAFERPDRESHFVQLLAAHHPSFDPGLSLVASSDGEMSGYALFLPREILIRGVRVPLAVAAPLGVPPKFRGHGIGRTLVSTGLAALADRGLRGAIAIGAPDYYGDIGFASAFDLHVVDARAENLPAPDESAGWRAITSEDLEALCRLQEESYEHASGTEHRLACPVEWDGQAPGSHALAIGAPGDPHAYLRFRVREELEVMECCANDADSVRAILAFIHQLICEHGRARALVHVPPETRTSTTLLHRGAILEHSTFGGGSMLAITDLPGLLEDLAPWWSPVLGESSFSIGFAGRSYRLDACGSNPRVTEGRAKHHLEVPSPALPGLLTGQRSARELLFDPVVRHQSGLSPEGQALACRLFPRNSSMWTYSPAFELVDA